MAGMTRPDSLQMDPLEPIDPCLDPCCAREVEDRKKANVIKDKLAAVDPSTAPLRERENVFADMSFCGDCSVPTGCGVAGCGVEHAGDYAALQRLREEAHGAGGNGGLGGDGSAGGVDFSEGDGFSDGRKGFGGGGGGGALDRGPASDEEEDEEDSDAELDAMMDELALGEDEELARIQAEAMAAMQEQAAHVLAAQSCGFGVHRSVYSSAAAIALTEEMPRLVCHVCDDRSRLCARVDLHLERVAAAHPGTGFIRVYATPDKPIGRELLDRLGLSARAAARQTAPALVALVDGRVVATADSLCQFGSDDALASEALDMWLQHTGTLSADLPSREWLKANAGKKRGRGGLGLAGRLGLATADDEGEDEVDYYDCGLEGCQKAFAHEHVSGRPDGAMGIGAM